MPHARHNYVDTIACSLNYKGCGTAFWVWKDLKTDRGTDKLYGSHTYLSGRFLKHSLFMFGVHRCQHARFGAQSTVCRTQFFLSTMFGPGDQAQVLRLGGTGCQRNFCWMPNNRGWMFDCLLSCTVAERPRLGWCVVEAGSIRPWMCYCVLCKWCVLEEHSAEPKQLCSPPSQKAG